MKSNRRKIWMAVAVGMLLFAAYGCRMLGKFDIGGQGPRFVRAFFYLSFFAVLTNSWSRSVVQRHTRQYMVSVGVLMVFWIFLRTVKYEFALPPFISKICWYFYYLPMLFIPLMGLFTALSIGKPEDKQPKTEVLWLITAALFLLVLTNDWHQLVFTFPVEVPFVLHSDHHYGYGRLYVAVIGWMMLCGVAMLIVMCAKCKVPYSKKFFWLPLVPMALTVAYAMAYWAGFPWLRFWLGDLPVTQSLLFTAIFEASLWCGLITSNTNYEELFKVVYTGMMITDDAYQIRYISDRALPLPEDVLRKTEGGSFRYGETLLLKASNINGGHTIWHEDLSELLSVRAELESIREELQDRNDILRDQYRRDAQRYKMEEQNRLYDLVQQETQKQLCQIDDLTDCYAEAVKLGEETKPILFRLLVLATYVKRHKDMVVLAERIPYMPIHALYAALQESCGNLELGGIDCNLYLPDSRANLPIRAALSAYACFEEVLEATLEQLRYLLVSVTRRDGVAVLSLTLDCDAALPDTLLHDSTVETERTEDGWIVTVLMIRGEDE